MFGSKSNITLYGSVAFLVIIALAVLVSSAGPYIAGQGDAREYAEEWVRKWHPIDGVRLDCQARDTDDNGYVTCTVGEPGGKISAIECGVNRWYHGFNVTGCRLMKGYGGSQP